MAIAKCVGFFDRSGIKPGSGNQTTGDDFNASRGHTAWPNSAYNAILGGFVMRSIGTGGGINWSELQAAAGAPAGSGALGGTAGAGISAIDHAFYVADGYNATNPTNIWTCKLRLFLGESAPAWAKALGGGPITSDNPDHTGAGTSTTTPWWDSTYEAAFEQFMLKLAAYVPTYTVTWTGGGQSLGANTQKLDGHPLFGEITEACCMTLYAEPLMKDDYQAGGRTNALAATPAMTDDLEFKVSTMTGTQIAAKHSMFVAFPNSVWSFAHNPMVRTQANNKSESSTEFIIDYNVGASLSPVVLANGVSNSGTPFPQVVLENNSLQSMLDSTTRAFDQGVPSSAPTGTHLIDTTKNWSLGKSPGLNGIWSDNPGAIVYCGGSSAAITSNTHTQLNFASWTGGTPAAGLPYTVYVDTHNANYTQMYTKMAGYTPGNAQSDLQLPNQIQPVPLCIQTSTLSRMTPSGVTSNVALKATIDYAIWLGARMVELPGDGVGYGAIGLSGADLIYWNAAIASLIANDPAVNIPGSTNSTKRTRHWGAFNHR